MFVYIPPPVGLAKSDIMVGRRTHDPVREERGRRNLAEAKIAEAIDRALVTSPPLTTAQKKRLAALLKGSQR